MRPKDLPEQETGRQGALQINIRSFLSAVMILLLLMALTFALTFLIPSGSYQREWSSGAERVIADSYERTDQSISLGRWIASPILVLFAPGGGTMLAIILFLLVIGGTFAVLEQGGLLRYMLQRMTVRFRSRRYLLLCALSLLFMLLGGCIGSFEECVPLVPIAISLCYAMGWDALVGLGVSLLSAGCGFATGLLNPFTVGVAQELAGLPLFSGLNMRFLSFIIIYTILIIFLFSYARRIERNPGASVLFGRDAGFREATALPEYFQPEPQMDRALLVFGGILAASVGLILLSSLVSALQNILLPLVAFAFLGAGLASALVQKTEFTDYVHWFVNGLLAILPAVLLILMAGSIRFTMTEAGILDTILHAVTGWIGGIPLGMGILLLYLLVLLLNFFIPSGSAKAFLIIPLIMPVADLVGMSRQLAVLAFAFGDGFSNLFFPTNPVLLLSLGVAGIGYGTWAKWTIRFQMLILFITSALLLFALQIGY